MNDDDISNLLGEGWKRKTKSPPPSVRDLLEIKARDKAANQCGGKRRHKTKKDALKEASASSDYLQVYLCPHCKFYHVGKGS